MWEIFLTGLILNAGLFLGIGPQNTFVIRQGLRGEHIWAVYAVCVFGEIILTLIGVFGLGVLFSKYIWIQIIVGSLGIIYLFKIAYDSFRDALQPEAMIIERLNLKPSLKDVFIKSFAITFLNPGVYTDTAIIIGGIASNYTLQEKFYFSSGSIFAAVILFAALGYGAKSIRHWFENVKAMRIIDIVVGILMTFIAFGLTIMVYESLMKVL